MLISTEGRASWRQSSFDHLDPAPYARWLFGSPVSQSLLKSLKNKNNTNSSPNANANPDSQYREHRWLLRMVSFAVRHRWPTPTRESLEYRALKWLGAVPLWYLCLKFDAQTMLLRLKELILIDPECPDWWAVLAELGNRHAHLLRGMPSYYSIWLQYRSVHQSPQANPPWWPPSWPSPVPDPIPGPVMEGTRGFRGLYAQVTRALREYADTHGDWHSEDKEFLEFLISGFWQEYVAWKTNGQVLDYLEKFQKRSLFKAFPVIGQAFLHMAYDLPRTVADCMLANPALALKDPKTSQRFVELEKCFSNMFPNAVRDRKIFGILSVPCRLLGHKSALLRLLGRWVEVLRPRAWIAGDILSKNRANRARMEAKLLADVNAAADEVVKKYWNPLYWTAFLTPPMVMSLLILSSPNVWNWLGKHWVETVGETIGASLCYVYAAYRGLVLVTGKLAYQIYRRIIEFDTSSEGETLPR